MLFRYCRMFHMDKPEVDEKDVPPLSVSSRSSSSSSYLYSPSTTTSCSISPHVKSASKSRSLVLPELQLAPPAQNSEPLGALSHLDSQQKYEIQRTIYLRERKMYKTNLSRTVFDGTTTTIYVFAPRKRQKTKQH